MRAPVACAPSAAAPSRFQTNFDPLVPLLEKVGGHDPVSYEMFFWEKRPKITFTLRNGRNPQFANLRSMRKPCVGKPPIMQALDRRGSERLASPNRRPNRRSGGGARSTMTTTLPRCCSCRCYRCSGWDSS
jgi:hypothetical protein